MHRDQQAVMPRVFLVQEFVGHAVSSLSEVPRVALLGLSAETVPAAEGPQRGVHRWHRLLQPLPHGGQFPAGTSRGSDALARTKSDT